jgi:hypothetical protein
MKNWFTSIIGDKEYDPDASKIVGMILCIVAIVGFFKQVNGWETMLYTGGGLVLGKCLRENT